MKIYWFASTNNDLVNGLEGFGLVATNDTAIPNERILHTFATALACDSQQGGGYGAFFTAKSDDRWILGWKNGGFRDHRGRPGGRVAQVFISDGPDGNINPAALRGIIGRTEFAPLSHERIMKRELPEISDNEFLDWVTGDLASPDPSAVAGVAHGLLQLCGGQEIVAIDSSDLLGSWDLFWRCIPPGLRTEISATTADSNLGSGNTLGHVVVFRDQPAAQREHAEATALSKKVTRLVQEVADNPLAGPGNCHRAIEKVPVNNFDQYKKWIINIPEVDGHVLLDDRSIVKQALRNPAAVRSIDQKRVAQAFEAVGLEGIEPDNIREYVRDPQADQTVIAWIEENVCNTYQPATIAALLKSGRSRSFEYHLQKDCLKVIQEVLAEGVDETAVTEILRKSGLLVEASQLSKALEAHDPSTGTIWEALLVALFRKIRESSDPGSSTEVRRYLSQGDPKRMERVENIVERYPGLDNGSKGSFLGKLWLGQPTPELLPQSGAALYFLATHPRARDRVWAQSIEPVVKDAAKELGVELAELSDILSIRFQPAPQLQQRPPGNAQGPTRGSMNQPGRGSQSGRQDSPKPQLLLRFLLIVLAVLLVILAFVMRSHFSESPDEPNEGPASVVDVQSDEPGDSPGHPEFGQTRDR